MKTIFAAVLALAFNVSIAEAATSRSCTPGSAGCKATADTAKKPSAPATAATPVSRRQGQQDDFYSFGLKN